MDITFLGHSCFKVKGKTKTVVFDPFDPAKVGYKLPKLEADVVCVSHMHGDHNYIQGVSGVDGKEPFLISGPGEYEAGGVHVVGFNTFHDNKEGKDRGRNTIYYVEIDGLFLLHLGDLGHFPQKEVLEELNSIDVLFVPVGGIYTIDYKVATEIVSELEPYYVVPMHFRTDKLTLSRANEMNVVDKFLAEWGHDMIKREPKLKISGKSDLPEETQIVVLEQGLNSK